jgi:hypothetical protein
MAKKLKWVETFTTTTWCECELTDEQAKLYEEDRDKFFEEVEPFGDNRVVLNDDVSSDEYDYFELVDE